MLVHRRKEDPDSRNCLDELGALLDTRIYNVHRLDRPASGLLIFCLNSDAAAKIAEEFRERSVDKRYCALVRGHLLEPMSIDRPLKSPNTGIPAPAKTIVRPLVHCTFPESVGPYSESWYSFVELQLITGRYHQARRHLHHINHPIIGDNRHGDRKQNRYFAEKLGCDLLFLRAVRLSFHHPTSHEPVGLAVAIPETWIRVMRKIGMDIPTAL